MLMLFPLSSFSAYETRDYIKASDTSSGAFFGQSLAISGSTLVVGASEENNEQGAAYVYVLDMTGTWAFQQKLTASNGEADDEFGYSVDIEGDMIVVGARREDSNTNGIGGDQSDNSAEDAGAVYVFTRSGATWSQQAYIKASNSSEDDEFGIDVSLSGNTMVVGAAFEKGLSTGINGDDSNIGFNRIGAVYAFVNNGGNWSQQAYIKPEIINSPSYDFGLSVAVDGDLMAIGARRENGEVADLSMAPACSGFTPDGTIEGEGAAYVYSRSGTVWSFEEKLRASNGSIQVRCAFDRLSYIGIGFGFSVSLSGSSLAIGAPFEFSSLTGVNPAEGDLGTGPGDGLSGGAGAAYVFNRDSSGVWAQEAYIKSLATGIGDAFGTSVSLSNDLLLIGANAEASNATGVGGDPSNNQGAGSGAAHLLGRIGSTWKHLQYLKQFTADFNDFTGGAVAVEGLVAAAGAKREDSAATNINGDQTDNSALNAGAVYTYGPDLMINAGMNDAWVSDDAPKQGWFFTVYGDIGAMFLSWFTFDSVAPDGSVMATFGAPDQRWVTGLGVLEGNKVTLTAELTTGGIFNGSDPVATQDTAYGTITIEFISCNEAIMTYEFPGVGLSGQSTVRRVLDSNVGACEVFTSQ